ncbi:MAG: exonuclease SbcCD subunit D [Clostridia bacterium]
MKFLHLSDLHIGKKVNEISMLEDQEYILNEILNMIKTHKPNAVIIAGDIYDKSIPPTGAVELLDDFFVSLSKLNVKTYAISGNHDSAERLAFGARLLENSGIFLNSGYDKNTQPFDFEDEFGTVKIHLLPFIKPIHIKQQFEEVEIESYTDAVKVAIDNMNIDPTQRNLLVTHQFVTGATKCDSEDISVGGSDNVDVSVFDDFDYVALGHLHGAQKIKRETVRYSGTPLKYSFSETKHKKSVPLVTMSEKGEVNIELLPLEPLHDMVQIKGEYLQVASKEFRSKLKTDDYIRITLTDENDVPDAMGKLRSIYPNIMKLDYDNKRTKSNELINAQSDLTKMSPLDLFCDFYKLQNNQKMTEEQLEFSKNLIEKIWEDESCDL